MRVTASSVPGSDTPNEDYIAVRGNLAVLLDGATARTETGCVHGIAWYVHQLAEAVIEHRDLPPADALALAIVQTANRHRSCDLEHPGTPSAAVGIVQLNGDTVDYLVLGDVTLVAETLDGTEVITDDRVSLTALAERAAADALPNGSPEKAQALVKMKQAELAVRNIPGGFWVATSDPRVVRRALIGKYPMAGLKRMALLTDGAARAVYPLGIHDWPELLSVLAAAGPAELIRQVRQSETTDPDATRWPRNKVHDDATAALIEFDDAAAEGNAGENDALIGSSDISEPEPVVAAVVTSPDGVLIARRNDGKPPWTFIAGKIEPGESPADAAIREVKEETELRVRVGGIIGRRVHPQTGRTMVYVAAKPTHRTRISVGDTDELAEVRWATLAEADELMGGSMYEPVRRYLRQVLKEDN